MDNAVDVVLEDNNWTVFDLEAVSEKAFKTLLNVLDISDGPYELCVLACDDARIRGLNDEFREKDTATNVLSWPSFTLQASTDGGKPSMPPNPTTGDPFVNLGDIAIAYETCMKEAAAAHIPPIDHVTHLLVHGYLHLLGYDHVTDSDAELMEKIEIDVLACLGIGNPYKKV